MNSEDFFLGSLPGFFEDHLPSVGGLAWLDRLSPKISENVSINGKLAVYSRLLSGLPSSGHGGVTSSNGAISICCPKDHRFSDEIATVRSTIMQLVPWRKGPFEIYGLSIDSEWRSDFKWSRLRPHIQPVKDRLVLDVGSGNGYFAWRMYLEGARAVICLEPNLHSVAQFRFCKHFRKEAPVEMLPIKSDGFTANTGFFDSVFSMGVLYHSRRPKQHLTDLRKSLRLGGELVLETLINDSENSELLVPSQRYAAMRNVWSLPSKSLIRDWLLDVGFNAPQCVDVTRTTVKEQRSTDLMPYHSLADALDPLDGTRTIEGYQGPIRGIFLATAG